MTLLDANGRPIRSSEVTADPQSAKVAYLKNAFIESHLEGISPAMASRLLRQADAGDILAQHQLFDDMLDRDPHLVCEFGKRSGAVQGLDWSVVPPEGASESEKKAAAWAEDLLKNACDDFEDALDAMMEAVGHGFAAIELEWRRWGGEWLPAFHPRPQTWFRLSKDRREILLASDSGFGEPLRPFGWILHEHTKAKTGYLGRSGICRCLIWPFIYKHYAVGDFAEFLETYGLPIILGKYHSGAKPSEKSSLMRAVTALGHDARAIMPREMELEVQKVTGTGDGDAHLKMVAWAEASQSKAILGQTLSATAQPTGLGSGVADLHGEVRHDILKADARRLSGTLARDLLWPLLSLNGKAPEHPRRAPRFWFDLGETEDLKTFAQTLPRLAACGMRIPLSWAHEKLRIPEAADGEAVFAPTLGTLAEDVPATDGLPSVRPVPTERQSEPVLAAMTATPDELTSVKLPSAELPSAELPSAGQPADSGAAPVSNPAHDAIDALIEEEAANWTPLIDPMLQTLQTALEEAAEKGETAAEVIARLPGLLAGMDAALLADTLTRAAFAARIAGLAGQSLDD